jgi:hypothetical protein
MSPARRPTARFRPRVREWLTRHSVGFLALFVALGGTAYAATAAKNSVTSASITKGAVRSSDIRNNAVKGIDVDEASLNFRGLTDLVGPRGEPGARGPQGERGETGAVGPIFATTFSNRQDPAPPARPDTRVLNGQYSHTFVTPVPGRLLVFASLNALGVSCTAGTANAFLYLDGIGVPGSGQRQPPAGSADPFTPITLTGLVAAGEHTLTISLDCPMGDTTADSSSGDGDLGAVLVGG